MRDLLPPGRINKGRREAVLLPGRRRAGEVWMALSRRAASGVSRRLVTMGAATAVAAMILGGTGVLAQGSGLGTADKPVEIRVSANEAFSNQIQTVIVP